MSQLDIHLARYEEFRAAAESATADSVRIETWFLAAYHLIEACAAKRHIHFQKHSRVAAELEKNPLVFGARTKAIVEAFTFLDREARARFVYGGSGTPSDLKEAREKFLAIEEICQGVLR